MAINAILKTLANIATCSPCAGTFGRWKANLQDDDADLWNDLTLVNAIPEVKPPDIPKVVEIISCSDGSSEDVSTLAYETSHYRSSPCHYPAIADNNIPREEEKSFTPSPKRTKASRYHNDPDLELERVFEEIGLEVNNNNDTGIRQSDSDEELESIMGPRSQISIAKSYGSRSIRRASSAPVATSSTYLPSLLQQQRDRYHSTARNTLHNRYGNSPCPSKEDSKEDQECRDSFDDEIPSYGFGNNREFQHDCDGSSYSSVHQKTSFFKKKRRSTLFRTSNRGGYKKAGVNGGWFPLEQHNESSTEAFFSTMKNKGHLPARNNNCFEFEPFH